MAFSAVTARGSITAQASAATVAMSPSANLTVGKFVVVTVHTDNIGTTDGTSNDHTALADNASGSQNVWTKATEKTDTDGAGNDGAVVSVWYSVLKTQIATTDTITCTLAGSVAARAITCTEATITLGAVGVADVGTGQGSITAASGALTSREYLFLYAASSEGNDLTKTQTTNYVEQHDFRTGNTGDVNISGYVQARIQTATSSGSIAPSAWTTAVTNPISVLVSFREDISVALTNVVGTSAVGTLVAAITIALTGVGATGLVGTLTGVPSVALTGVSATGEVGTVLPPVEHPVGIITQLTPSGIPGQRYGDFSGRTSDATVGLTGVSATGGTGTLGVSFDVALTGVSSTGNTGTVTPAFDLALTGVSGTGAAGTVTAASSPALTGVEGTGALGTVTVSFDVPLTGVLGTGQTGTVGAGSEGTAALTGVEGTGGTGSLGVTMSVALTGTSGTGGTGTLTPGFSIALTGVGGTGSVGTLTAGGDVTGNLTGVEGTGSVGSVTVSSTVPLTGEAATSSPGLLTPEFSLALTGVQATGETGETLSADDIRVALTGVQANGQLGTFTEAGQADGEIVYVPAEDRTIVIPAHDRTVLVDAQDRTILVPERPTP